MNKQPALGDRVEVYWNLHKKCYSVRAMDGPNRGRVIMHADKVNLTNVKLVVQPAGQNKVRREGRKNVHAFVRGLWGQQVAMNGLNLTYNPYLDDTFVVGPNRQPVTSVGRVQGIIRGDGKPQMLASL